MKKWRGALSIVLSVLIAFGVFTAVPFQAAAAGGVTYIERAWNEEAEEEEERILSIEKTCTDYTEWSDVEGTSLAPGWYVVSKNCTVGSRMIVESGAVHLILCDGVTMTLQKGIGIKAAGELYIYGQSNDTGKIYANIHFPDGTYDHECALIGGVKGENCGNITVYGGTIDLTYLSGTGACIGGAEGRGGGMTRIYGGHVNCQQQAGSGAAIGGGYKAAASRFEQEAIQIYGGKIDAKSWGGASIGSGLEGNSGKDAIGIYGGTVNAQCSTGAGIGGGENGKNGPIHIYGGEINTVSYAEGYTGAGIGSGLEQNQGGTIDISGGIVVATSRNGAGIGAGKEGSASQINITGGTIVASSTEGGAGIGGGADGGNGGTIHIENAKVVACSSNYNSMADATDDILKCLNKTNPNPSDHGESVVGVFLGILALIVDGFGADQSGCGIGGGSCGGSASSITIQNSNVTAKSGNYSAAIGSGEKGDIDTITIENSTITAESGKYGAAIGTGDEADKKVTIDIKSSTIDAASGDDAAAIGTGNEVDSAPSITITDSNVTANGGEYAASIGGGDDVSGGNITIDHSTVIADRALYYYLEEPHDERSIREHRNCDGAGIGGGEDGDGGTIVIQNNSHVTVHGGPYAAGIGGGDNGDGGNITIRESTVKAYGGMDAAGIGGGEGGDGGNITIINSDIYAEGKSYGAGIGNGEDGDKTDIKIHGSNNKVEAVAGEDGDAAAIGKGDNGIFYSYHISRWFEETLACDAGSDKNHTARYYGDDRYTATKNAKYVYLHACEHKNAQWIYDSDSLHVKQCTDCGLRDYTTAGYHEWNESNVCTVCGSSAVMQEITFVEQDASGNQVTSKIKGPVSGTIKAPASTHAPEGMEFVCWSESGAYYAGAGEDIGVSNRERTFEAVYLPVTQATYIERGGEEKTVSARRLTHTNLELTAGWYVVDSDVQSIEKMTISGDVNLILADGATFSFYQGYSHYDLEHIDCLITKEGTTSTLSVYGQKQQTGTLLLGKRHTVLTDFAQYGGVVDSETGFFESTKNCVVSGGTFKAAVLVCDRAAILGGNTAIGDLPLNKSLQLGWQMADDTIHFDKLESEEVSIVEGQAVKDDEGNLYKGILTAAQVEALAGKTLTAASEHRYGEPEWIWADAYCNAVAVFTCSDCGEKVQISAKVSVEDKDNIRTSTATCRLEGKTYTATHTTKILWDITVKESAHGSLSTALSKAKAGEYIALSVAPETGYALDTLTATDEKDNEIEIENHKFKMPESDVTVSASFVKEDYSITYAPSENGAVTGAASAHYGDTVSLNVKADEGAVLASLAVRDAQGNDIALSGSTFTMPAAGVTVSAVFVKGSMVEQTEPYIDESGAYIPGTVRHFAAQDGTKYAVDAAGNLGEELESVALSYFEFHLLNNDTYQINHFTGPTAGMTELVIPKTYNGKKITVVGSSDKEIFYTGEKSQFSLVLNENIEKIERYTFYTLWVTEVTGDTSGLKELGSYAFSWANSPGGYTIDLHLQREGSVTLGYGSLNHMNARFYLKHATVLDNDNSMCTSTEYCFTDAHRFGEPEWTWAEDFSSAEAVFTCTDSRCQHRQAVAAHIDVGVKDAVRTYVAKADMAGKTYTDVKTVGEKAENAVNLTLGSDITSHYYIDYRAYEGAAKIVYSYNTVNEKEEHAPQTQLIDLSNIPAAVYDAASDRVKLTVSQAPAQIAEATHIEILDGAGNVLEAFDYSAKTYCDKVTGMSEGELAAYAGSEEKAAQLKTLAHSLVAYAEAAQGVFANYETVKVSCESEQVKAQIAAATATPHHSVDNSGMIKFSSLSFVCTKDARLRLYLNTAGATDTPAAPEASRGKAALKYITKGGAKQYFVELGSIDAADFGEQITVSYGGSVITCSVLDYCGIVLGDGSGASAAIKQLAKALVVYHTNAKEYFN